MFSEPYLPNGKYSSTKYNYTSLRKSKAESKELTAEEIQTAETLWIKFLQRKQFMTKNGKLHNKQRQSQLTPRICDDDIFGRLINAELRIRLKGRV